MPEEHSGVRRWGGAGETAERLQELSKVSSAMQTAGSECAQQQRGRKKRVGKLWRMLSGQAMFVEALLAEGIERSADDLRGRMSNRSRGIMGQRPKADGRAALPDNSSDIRTLQLISIRVPSIVVLNVMSITLLFEFGFLLKRRL
ncbi:MAG: hypothetical protein ACKO2P_07805 [Planctomycetota bacterium]